MTVSIFSAPELVITDLSHYLPLDTTALIMSSACPMCRAAFAYAYEKNIPFTELAPITLPSYPQNISSSLTPLLTRSEHIVLFSTPFSDEIKEAVRYCKQNKIAYTVFTLVQST
ncbi:MAG: hypothetical protein R3Y06_00135 [Faecalibacterium sp.]